MHSSWDMKGTAEGRQNPVFEHLIPSKLPFIQLQAIHGVLIFDGLYSTKLISYLVLLDKVSLCWQIWPFWVDGLRKGSHMKQSSFLLSLPRAPFQRNGARSSTNLILVHLSRIGFFGRSVFASNLIATAAMIGRMKEIWRTRVDQSLSCASRTHLFEVLQPYCLPNAGIERSWNQRWAQEWAGSETVDSIDTHKWSPAQSGGNHWRNSAEVRTRIYFAPSKCSSRDNPNCICQIGAWAAWKWRRSRLLV